MLVRWLIFIHVLAAIAFFLFHGVSAVMAFRLRKETDLARLRALLDLSWTSLPLMGVSLGMMGLPYMKGNKNFPAEALSKPEEVEAHIRKTSVMPLAAPGLEYPRWCCG